MIVLGDSLAVGLFATTTTGGYAYQLAERGGYDLDLLGGSGRNVCVTQQKWDEAQAAGVVADVVVIEIGLNDIGTYLDCLPEADWPAAYGALLSATSSSGARVVAVNLFWAGLPDWSENYQRAIRYNGYIAQAAAERGIAVADVWAATEGCLECLSQPGQASAFAPYYGDKFHPGDHGHGVIADVVFEALFPHRVYYPLVTSE